MKKSLTNGDWLRAAMELLRTQDLQDSMLAWWDRAMTDTMIEQTGSARGSAEKRLDYIISLFAEAGI